MNIGPFFLSLLQRRVHPEAQCEGTQFVMRYSLGVRVTSIVFAIFIALSSVHVFFYPKFKMAFTFDSDGGTTDLIITLFFCVISIYLLVGAWIYKITYNDNYITIHSPWARTKYVPWTSVQSYSRTDNDVCVKTETHGCFCVSSLLNGVSSFQNMLAQHATFYPNTNEHRAKC